MIRVSLRRVTTDLPPTLAARLVVELQDRGLAVCSIGGAVYGIAPLTYLVARRLIARESRHHATH